MIERIPFPKQKENLPVVLSRAEVARLLDAVDNLMHRTILMILYGTGLGISEALALHVRDFDSERTLLRVRHAKGGRERYAPSSETLLRQLRAYWKQHRPGLRLFPCADSDSPLGQARRGRSALADASDRHPCPICRQGRMIRIQTLAPMAGRTEPRMNCPDSK